MNSSNGQKHFLSDSDQSASHPCWQIIPQSLGKFHAHSNNLSQQCVICWPEVISVLKENPKLIRKWKGFWNWSLGMQGIWGMKMESASSATASKRRQQPSTCPLHHLDTKTIVSIVLLLLAPIPRYAIPAWTLFTVQHLHMIHQHFHNLYRKLEFWGPNFCWRPFGPVWLCPLCHVAHPKVPPNTSSGVSKLPPSFSISLANFPYQMSKVLTTQI